MSYTPFHRRPRNAGRQLPTDRNHPDYATNVIRTNEPGSTAAAPHPWRQDAFQWRKRDDLIVERGCGSHRGGDDILEIAPTRRIIPTSGHS
jgi:hypothetical protein